MPNPAPAQKHNLLSDRLVRSKFDFIEVLNKVSKTVSGSKSSPVSFLRSE